MYCKKGDLAIVVRSKLGNLGKIVLCEELMYIGDLVYAYDLNRQRKVKIRVCFPTLWRINVEVNVFLIGPNIAVRTNYISDHCLRPLGDPDMVDELIKEKEVC